MDRRTSGAGAVKTRRDALISSVFVPGRRAVEVDGSAYSGSGSIVRHAVAYASVTGRDVQLRNVRARRPRPGLRPQHVRAVQAVGELVGGTFDGVGVGSRSFSFSPGRLVPQGRYVWDVGTSGSATALALAVLPVLARRGQGVEIELQGGLFQDFAPSVFHLQHVLLPLIAGMGVRARLELVRPGYVPTGHGVVRLSAPPPPEVLRPCVLEQGGRVQSVWGIALSSHLDQREVSPRMARAARAAVAAAGLEAEIDERNDVTAAQPGAAFALFADLSGGARLGADCAGAPHRRAETIGTRVARQLQEEIASSATLDRFAADQVLPFAALAAGDSVFRVRSITEHVMTGAWLASLFLDVDVDVLEGCVVVHGRSGVTG